MAKNVSSEKLNPISKILALIVIAMGSAVIAGWFTGSGILKSVFPGLVAMNPATASAFILSGLAVLLLADKRPSFKIVAMTFASVIILIGSLRILGYLTPHDFQVDKILFRQRLGTNVMAPNTAWNFLLLGLALAGIEAKNKIVLWMQQFFLVAALLTSMLAIIGYAYSVKALYNVPSYIPMAFNTAVTFLLSIASVFCLNPERGLMATLTADYAGSEVARRLVPPAVLIPFLLGGLSLIGIKQGFYGTAIAVALLAVMNMTVFAALVWWTAGIINQTDRARRGAQKDLQRAYDELEAQIKEQEDANQKLQESYVQLGAANAELEAFSYSVSHDLRAPLRHMDGFLGLLQKQIGSGLDEKASRYLKTASDSANQMGKLIDDLLSFSRMTRTEMKYSPIQMKPLVDGILREMKEETKNRKIEWSVGDLLDITGDAAMIKQVMVNMISNAVKYTSKGENARIEIGSLKESESEIVFFVRDNGVGFNMDYKDKLFGVFQRLHRADEFEGTGIGLANVRRIISRHGGKTWAESPSEGGAVFYFSLPHHPNIRSRIPKNQQNTYSP